MLAVSPNTKIIDLIDSSNASMMRLNPRGARRSSEEKARELEISGMVSGKNILITGAAAGLGNAFFNHFLQFGAKKICIIDIDEASSRKIVNAVEKSHGPNKVFFLHADVSKQTEITAAFKEAISLMKSPIDIIINNAGILDERRWEREVAVNLTGMITVSMLAIEHMGKDKGGAGGVLVNIAEHSRVQYTAQLPVYYATKQAIVSLSQSLGAPSNTERTGVRVITLCPGLTETALTIDSPNKLLSRVMKADFVKSLEQLTIQTPYVVAQGLMWILRIGESASIWVIENGQSPYEVFVPQCRSLQRHYKNNFTVSENKIMSKGRPIRETGSKKQRKGSGMYSVHVSARSPHEGRAPGAPPDSEIVYKQQHHERRRESLALRIFNYIRQHFQPEPQPGIFNVKCLSKESYQL
uniref:Alcohol dehydrogenase n=1 Tax=Trichogramma kaykai TaxID=54128 RepID=A0ABD2X1S0_9HYME